MPTPLEPLPQRHLSRRPGLGLAALGVTAALLFAYYSRSPNFHEVSEQDLYGGDYFQEWVGGRLVAERKLAPYYDPIRAETIQHDPEFTGFSWQSSRYFPLVYPPFYYAIVSPLSHLPYKEAARVWAALMTVCYLLAAALLSKYFADRGPDALAPFAILIVPAGLVFAPIAESLVMNQKGTLCLLILTGTFALLRGGRAYAAGLCFGWLFFKPQLALPILLVMVWKRQRYFVAGSFTTLTFLATIAAATGVDACSEYIQFIGQAPDYIYNVGYSVSRSHCLDSFFHSLLAGHESLARGLAGISVITLACTSLWLVKGPLQFDSPRFGLQFSGLILATLLISPHLYGYDLSLLLLPFVIILAIVWPRRAGKLGKATLYLLLALFSLTGLSEFLAEVIGVQLSVVLMLALFGILVTLSHSMTSWQDHETQVSPARC